MARRKIDFAETGRVENSDVFGPDGPAAPPAKKWPGTRKLFEAKTRVFTDLEISDLEAIDRIVAKRQMGQAKVVTRAAVIRELLLEALENSKS